MGRVRGSNRPPLVKSQICKVHRILAAPPWASVVVGGPLPTRLPGLRRVGTLVRACSVRYSLYPPTRVPCGPCGDLGARCGCGGHGDCPRAAVAVTAGVRRGGGVGGAGGEVVSSRGGGVCGEGPRVGCAMTGGSGGCAAAEASCPCLLCSWPFFSVCLFACLPPPAAVAQRTAGRPHGHERHVVVAGAGWRRCRPILFFVRVLFCVCLSALWE